MTAPFNVQGLISVLLPVHNGERFIDGAIRSVLTQSYPNLELLVVDDGSTDGTWARVRRWNDPRLVTLSHRVNRGVAAARNTALAAATGEYVAVIDADDEWVTTRLEQLLKAALVSGGPVFVADDIQECIERSGSLVPWRTSLTKQGVQINGHFREFDLTTYLRAGFAIRPLFPTQELRAHRLSYFEGCQYGEDFEFHVRVFLSGIRLRVIPEALYLYRRHDASLSSSADRVPAMRGVLGRLLATPGLSPSEQRALRRRGSSLVTDFQFRRFSDAVRARRWSAALKIGARSPRVIARALGKVALARRPTDAPRFDDEARMG